MLFRTHYDLTCCLGVYANSAETPVFLYKVQPAFKIAWAYHIYLLWLSNTRECVIVKVNNWTCRTVALHIEKKKTYVSNWNKFCYCGIAIVAFLFSITNYWSHWHTILVELIYIIRTRPHIEYFVKHSYHILFLITVVMQLGQSSFDILL